MHNACRVCNDFKTWHFLTLDRRVWLSSPWEDHEAYDFHGDYYGQGRRMQYARCGQCHTNISHAVIIGHNEWTLN